MEPAKTLQRLDQKRLDKVNRARGMLDAEESLLTETEKDIVIE
jgi:hypothetical protein